MAAGLGNPGCGIAPCYGEVGMHEERYGMWFTGEYRCCGIVLMLCAVELEVSGEAVPIFFLIFFLC